MDIVVGGGIVGLSIAWRLARSGRSVTVVDPAPASGASHAAAGMLAPVSEVTYTEEPLLRLGLAGLRRWPSFASELAADAGLDAGTGLGAGTAGTELGAGTGLGADARVDRPGADGSEPGGSKAGGSGSGEAVSGLSDAARAGLDFRVDGTLAVAFGADDLAALGELAAFMEKLGLPVERLTGRECRRLEPMLAPSVRGGLLARSDAWVDPRRVTTALLAALERLDVPLVRARVSDLLRDGNQVVGVRLTPPDRPPTPDRSPVWSGSPTLDQESARRTPHAHQPSGEDPMRPAPPIGEPAIPVGGLTQANVPDEIRGERVILAAGAWSAGLVDVPVRPVKGQIMRLRSPQPLLGRCVRGTVHGASVYLVPRGDGELVVGATQEELGFDTRVTAGGLYELLRDARELVPGVTELEVADVEAGLRPGTPDNVPLIGPSGTPGLVLATGHHRGGVLLAPLTAAIVLGEEGELAELCSPLRYRDIS
ncbi:FAD-dependent oxidoreductase [Nonomuraea guangzhouensis]|uniref:FAD-dependent oxidoreductase n=1 Tax=Nonomuraea guangzhouensis TaxID=1291555 RepID=A0ABW4G224_9ACTN|nr:FAD-dependent oxidoreductase [Nonomuraea guangzhouensis]